MNKTPKKSNSFKMSTLVKIALVLACVGMLLYGYNYQDTNLDDYSEKAINASLEKYEKVKKTDLSSDLHPTLVKIISHRKECFATQATYSARSKTCKRIYTNEIVQMARHNVKSAPMRGLFIRCVRTCPIAGSLCSGEEGTNKVECVNTEARCIEYCLDKYWRGASVHNGGKYNYKKKN